MKWKKTALLLLILLILPACTFIHEPDRKDEKEQLPPNKVIQKPKEGGTITIGLDVEHVILDPLGVSVPTASIYHIDAILYRGLFKYDENFQLTPDLASSIDLNQEEKKITIYFNKNVKWQDETPITVDDVQYSFERYSQANYNGKWKEFTYHILGAKSFRIGDSEHISGITISPEVQSITIQMDELTINNLQLLTAPILPKHQLAEMSIEEIKQLAANGTLLSSGPFKIDSIKENEWIIVRNDTFEETVYLDQIHFIDDNKQDVDLLIGLPQQVSENIRSKALEQRPGQSYYYLGMDLNHPVLKDIGTRKAIYSVLNYQQVIKNVFQTYASYPTSPIHPNAWLYESVELEKTNEDETKKILSGKSLTLQLAFEDLPIERKLAEEISMQLQTVGIQVELTPIQRAQYIPRLFSKGDFDLFLASWPYELDPIGENMKWLTKNDVLEGGYNVSHVHDEISDNLLIGGSTTLNSEERKRIYKEWQEHFMHQTYIIPLASTQLIMLAEPILHTEITNSIVPYVNIQKWWIEK